MSEQKQSCKCTPGHACAQHNGHSQQPATGGKCHTCGKPAPLGYVQCKACALADCAPKPKVQCKLCACEGVDGTVLCREHLDGYNYCCNLMPSKRAALMRAAIQQAQV